MRGINVRITLMLALSLYLFSACASGTNVSRLRAKKGDVEELATYRLMRRARDDIADPKASTLDPVPEHEDLVKFTSKEEIAQQAEAARRKAAEDRQREMLSQLGLDENAVNVGENSNAGGANNAVKQRASWLRRVHAYWKARMASLKVRLASIGRSKPATQIKPSAGAIGEGVPTLAPRFTAEEIAQELNDDSKWGHRQNFDINAIRNAPRTEVSKIPVIRLESLDNEVLNAISFADGYKKQETVFLAFTNGQVFRVSPQRRHGFSVKPLEDRLALARVQEALARPPVLPPPPKKKVKFAENLVTAVHESSDPEEEEAALGEHNLHAQNAPAFPSAPLSDEEKIKQALADNGNARFYDVQAFAKAPRTAEGVRIIQYETLQDSVVNAFDLVENRGKQIYLVSPEGQIAHVQQQANGELGVRMVNDATELSSVRTAIQNSAANAIARARGGTLAPARALPQTLPPATRDTDLYPVGREAQAANQAAQEATRSSRDWWSTVASGARDMFGKVKPSLQYVGHAA